VMKANFLTSEFHVLELLLNLYASLGFFFMSCLSCVVSFWS
jgi:hypothetical protein